MNDLIDVVHDASGISTLLVLFSQQVHGGIFTRITMTSMTSAWYHRITPFESVLLGLLILQIFVMRYFLILPLNLTKLIDDGTLLSTAVKKKRSISTCNKETQRVSETMFTVLRRLDEHDCLLYALCELQKLSLSGNQLPKETKVTLSALNRSGRQRKRRETPNNVTMIERPIISVFEEAVLEAGEEYQYNVNEIRNNSSTCQLRYGLCPLTKEDIINAMQSFRLS